MTSPTLTTSLLVLRALRHEDAPAIRMLAGEREIAATTLTIPHPYPEGAAEEFIRRVSESDREGKSVGFAVTLRESGALCGTIGLLLDRDHRHAEVGYWIGVPYWGRGYATEAAAEVLRHGFEDLALHRIYAHHFRGNPASGRVLQKLGMRHEGTLREHILKWGEYIDVEQYGILRAEWRASRDGSTRVSPVPEDDRRRSEHPGRPEPDEGAKS